MVFYLKTSLAEQCLVVRTGCALVVCASCVRSCSASSADISAQSVRLCVAVVRSGCTEPNLHNHVAQPKEVMRLEWHNQTRMSVWHNFFMLGASFLILVVR